MTQPRSPVRDIVFATDLSTCSAAAAKVAVEYAVALNARLHVVHVTVPGSGTVPSEGSKILGRDVPPAIPVVTSVETGSPAAQIVRYARRCGADLIVVGTHGRSGVSRVLLGSVAERVVRTASCPVLAVPLRPRRREHAAEETSRALPSSPGCLVCRRISDDLICDACRDRIRAESLDRKLEAMRKGRG